MRHEIKIGKDFATAILSGEKNFEIRKNDRGVSARRRGRLPRHRQGRERGGGSSAPWGGL